MEKEPFIMAVSDGTLTDLRERLARTLWPNKVANAHWEYGTNLTYIQELVAYWRYAYDWRCQEHSINAFAHHRFTIDEAPSPCPSSSACEADAQQALATFVQRLRATVLHQAALRPLRRDDKRGRPGQGAFPTQVLSMIDGALASSIAAHQALASQQSCFLLATNERDNTQLPPQEL